MERWQGKVALVTGASTGIGAAICQELVKHGMKVVGCARSVDKIKELAADLEDGPGSLTAIYCDLSQTDQIEPMFLTIKDKFGGVDVCINNAGTVFPESLLEGNLSDWHNMMNVNFMSAALCSRLTIQGLMERPGSQGQVININSTLGHQVAGADPSLHFYCCTKYAMNALTEALMYEAATLESTTVRVSQVSPGLVSTPIFRKMTRDQQQVAMLEKLGMKPSGVAQTVTFILSMPHEVQVREAAVEPTPKKAETDVST